MDSLKGKHYNNLLRIPDIESDDYDSPSTHSLRRPPHSHHPFHRCAGHSAGSGGHHAHSPARHKSRSPRPPSRSPLPEGRRGGSRSPLPLLASPDHRHSGSGEAFDAIYGGQSCPNEVELRNKIKALEQTVADHERQKTQVMGTFREFRERLAEKERSLEAEYSARIIALSQDVLAAKQDFENRMREYQNDQERCEKDKQAALERLRQEHQEQIQSLEKRCSEAHLVPDLEARYILEIRRLDEERRSLQNERNRCKDSIQDTMMRAQVRYESELQTAKALYANELNALKDHENKLRDELAGRTEEFQDRIEHLNVQLQQSQEQLTKSKAHVGELETELRKNENEVRDITKQLDVAKYQYLEAQQKLQLLRQDFAASSVRNAELEDQLIRKQECIASLENTKHRLEVVCSDLRDEIKSMKKRVEFLEKENKNMEQESESQMKMQRSQMETLETFVDNLTKEKENLQDQFEERLDQERMAHTEREFKMQQQFQTKLNDMERQNRLFQERLEQKYMERREKLREELERDILTSTSHTENIQAQMDELRSELHDKIQEAEREVETLRSTLHEKEESLAEANTEIRKLTVQHDELKGKLDEEVGAERKVGVDMQQEWERRLEEERQRIRDEVEKEVSRADDSVADTASLASKIEELTQRLEEKEREINEHTCSPEGIERLQDEIQKAQKRISDLETELETSRAEESEEEDEESEDDSGEAEKAKEELAQELEEARSALEAVSAKHTLEITEMMDKIKAQEVALKDASGLEAKLREKLEREFEERFTQRRSSDESSGEQNSASTSTQKSITLDFEDKIRQLEEAIEKKEQEKLEHMQQLSNQVDAKEFAIQDLQDKMTRLETEIDDMTEELDSKQDEMQEMKKHTEEYIRRREEAQQKAHRRELERIRAEKDAMERRQSATEGELKAAIEKLNRRSSLQSDEVSITDSTSELEENLRKLKADLEEKDSQIKKLLGEKAGLVNELEIAKHDCRRNSIPTAYSVPQTPRGSCDNLRKTSCGSLCEGTGSYPTVSKRANMAIVHKWHRLVSQVQQGGAVPSCSRPRSPGGTRYGTPARLNVARPDSAGSTASAPAAENRLKPTRAAADATRAKSRSPAPAVKKAVDQKPPWKY